MLYFFYFGVMAGRCPSTGRADDIRLSRVAAWVQSWSIFSANHILPPFREFRARKSLPFPSLDVIFHLPVFSLYTAATLSFQRWSTVMRTASAALASTTVCTLTAPDYLTRALSACPTLCKSKVQNIIRQLHLQQIANYSTFFKIIFEMRLA